MLMAYEYAPKDKRGFYASLPQIGLAIGLCLASGVVALLSSLLTDEQFLAWGWRLGFLPSIVLVAVGMYIRLNIMETPEFARSRQKGEAVKLPFVEMISNYPGNVLARHGRALHRRRVLQRVRRVLDRLSDADAEGRRAPMPCWA